MPSSQPGFYIVFSSTQKLNLHPHIDRREHKKIEVTSAALVMHLRHVNQYRGSCAECRQNRASLIHGTWVGGFALRAFLS